MAKQTVLIGLGLIILGLIAPLLMVLHLIAPTFWLSFLSYAASIAGLFLGLAGAAQISIMRQWRR